MMKKNMFEKDIMSVQDQLKRMNGRGVNQKTTHVINFEDAIDYVQDHLVDKLVDERSGSKTEIKDSKVFTKQMLRDEKDRYRVLIEGIMDSANFKIAGYDNHELFIKDAVEEVVGYSVLSDAFDDPTVTDIFVISHDLIFVERNDSTPVEYERKFRSEKQYHDFIERVLKKTGKEVNSGDKKIVDADFYEDRIAVTSKSVSPISPSMTIRKHKESHILLDQIIKGGTMNQEVADLFEAIIEGELNLIYAGITGSGKTTTLRALLDKSVPAQGKRMIIVEDTQELFPKSKHTLQMVTSKGSRESDSVTLRDLILTSLRLKPKYIVVGEVRGVEAEAAVEAMETGHSTLFSMHGGVSMNIINRLINKYLMQMPSLSVEVVERIIGSSLDYIAIQDDIPGIGRRVTSINEISYDYRNRHLVLIRIMEYDFETGEFKMINKISPEKGRNMMRRGVPSKKVMELVRDKEESYIE